MHAKTYRVGSAEISRIDELTLGNFTPSMLFPAWAERHASRLPLLPDTVTADGNHLPLHVHGWLIRDRGRTILVDTAVGNHKERPYAPYFHRLETPFLRHLAEAGVAPDDVDYVLSTHLHVDHTGWNTWLENGVWVPTFPKARYLFSRQEYLFFTDPVNHSERNRTSFQVQIDSVTPVIEAGLAEMIAVTGQEVIAGFSFHPTPGHTGNHATIILESQGEYAVFSGDVLHHPVQVADPGLFSVFDPERDKTLRSRRWALDYAADHDALFCSSHFPSTSAGRVRRRDVGYEWQFQ
ncbi:MAG: MBL fold metallo-hydrolase [Azospirillaceae bacterium]|nr:MBL fold metallo-hydrolase [Azospirillaceae bacterium]